MLVGYMRVSSESDRQTTHLQKDALLVVGIDERHLFEDHLSGSRDDRPGLKKALKFLKQGVDEKCSFQETLQLLKSLFR